MKTLEDLAAEIDRLSDDQSAKGHHYTATYLQEVVAHKIRHWASEVTSQPTEQRCKKCGKPKLTPGWSERPEPIVNYMIYHFCFCEEKNSVTEPKNTNLASRMLEKLNEIAAQCVVDLNSSHDVECTVFNALEDAVDFATAARRQQVKVLQSLVRQIKQPSAPVASPSLAEEAQPAKRLHWDSELAFALAEEFGNDEYNARISPILRKYDLNKIKFPVAEEAAPQKCPDVCPRCGSTDPVARRQTVGSPERSCWPGSMDHNAWHDAKPADLPDPLCSLCFGTGSWEGPGTVCKCVGRAKRPAESPAKQTDLTSLTD